MMTVVTTTVPRPIGWFYWPAGSSHSLLLANCRPKVMTTADKLYHPPRPTMCISRPRHMKMFDNFCEKKDQKKPKHFVELISNFNNLSDFSHSSTFQTRVYFFSKPSKNVTNWKKNNVVYRDCIYSLYVYSWLRFFFRCVCASAWSLTLIYAGRKVFSIHFGGLTLQKTWFWIFPPQFTHPKIIYHTM